MARKKRASMRIMSLFHEASWEWSWSSELGLGLAAAAFCARRRKIESP